jgi:hypothetical protein
VGTIVGAATTAYLYFTRPSVSPERATVGAAPGGLSLRF